MATITSTIKLVDQMSPTLNKISKAIDRVNAKSKSIGSSSNWGGFNTGIHTSTKSANNLYNSLRRVAYTLMALRSLKGAVDVADNMMNATARINNINDGLYTTSEYLDIIYSAAQRSRGSFSGMATSVSKLGTVASHAFSNVNEMIAFTELMNKLFVISGASAAESSNAMYQLTQAMAAGKLQGDEMRSILENAPLLAQKIAKSLGVSIGELKELGAEGEITADVIKKALFDSADEIEKKFSNMPKTIGQVWTEIKNHALNAFRPVITKVQQFLNSPVFESFKNRVFSIITAIANAVIRLFDAIMTPRVQNAFSKIATALGVLWEIFSSVAVAIANGIIWIADNWSWLGQIVYSVIAIVLLYKAVMLAVSAAVCVAEIAQGIAAWVAALMAGNAWALVILIIVALVAIIYLGVAAWNKMTDSAVSATGVLFGSIAFVVSGVIWLFQVIWDAFVLLCKILWQLCVDIFETCAVLFTNLLSLVLNIFAALGTGIREVGIAIGGTFKWLWELIKTWGSNVASGIGQLCEQLPLYWQMFGLKVKEAFWNIVVSAGNAFNNLLQGAADLANKMIAPFVRFGNAVIGVFNTIIRGWNAFANKLTFTIPGVSIFGKQLWESTTIHAIGGQVSELSKITGGDVITASKVNLSGAEQSLLSAQMNQGFLSSKIKDINWSSNALPEYSQYADWGSVGESIKNAFNTNEYESLSGIWDGSKYSGIWDSFKNGLSNNVNPIEAFKNWSDKGAKLEDGVNGLVDAIGGLLSGLFGDNSSTNKPLGELNRGQGIGSTSLPSSLEDLLSGSPSVSGSPIGSIKDNTGKAADSLVNIEDTMDLAEEELELLRSLAEQEVINRFTTAEIRVDMTNNNNINSGMDLDGIVTHLSTKLYEELGVVASGVHY